MSGQDRPPVERRLPPATPPQVMPQAQVVSLETLTYQVGSVQSQLTHGLESLNRTLERGLDNVDRRLLTVESATNEIQRTLVAQDARLAALEEFRREAEQESNRLKQTQEQELKMAVDGSQQAKFLRWLAGIVVGLVTIAGIIVSIVAAAGGF